MCIVIILLQFLRGIKYWMKSKRRTYGFWNINVDYK